MIPYKELQAAILALGHTIELDRVGMRTTSADMVCSLAGLARAWKMTSLLKQ